MIALFAAAIACVHIPNSAGIIAQDAPAYMEACNVTPVGWRPMISAPRDGSVIEIRNAFGSLPTYSIDRWGDQGGQKAWVDAKPQPPCPPASHGSKEIKDKHGKVVGWESWSSCGGVLFFDPSSEPGLAWRPYAGRVEDYREHNPTMAEWRAAR